MQEASDVGFLLVDRGRKDIRFEGDRERWRIPVSALSYCEVESFAEGHGAARFRSYFTVLRLSDASRFWEAPIRQDGGTGVAFGWRRKRAAQRLAAMINELRERKPEHEALARV